MSTTKEEITSMLNNLPDDCSFEDIQYHLYVLEKIRRVQSELSQKEL
jgi:hypothetical protein